MADLEKYNGGSLESLVFVANGEPRTTSILVAEKFGKRHDNVLQSIEALIKGSPENFNLLNFQEIEYVDGKGRSQKMYELSRDGFVLLAMGFTGKEALQWKLRYIEAFNRMEKALQERVQVPPTPSWRIALEDPRERLALYEKAASISERYGCPDPRSRLMIEDGIRNALPPGGASGPGPCRPGGRRPSLPRSGDKARPRWRSG